MILFRDLKGKKVLGTIKFDPFPDKPTAICVVDIGVGEERLMGIYKSCIIERA